jgi:hypothetical protein
MSKFYFNVLQGSGVAEDMKGTELPGLEEAKAMAQVTARELLANAIKGGNQNPPEIVTISDESGQKLAKIALRGVLPEPLK